MIDFKSTLYPNVSVTALLFLFLIGTLDTRGGAINNVAIAAEPSMINLPVPTKIIIAGATIDNVDLVDRSFPTSAIQPIARFAARDAVVGRIARRTLLSGQPIATDAIRLRPSIQAGQTARIVYEVEGLQISADGVALEAGAIGDRVRVRNLRSGIIISGKVLSTNTIIVEAQ